VVARVHDADCWLVNLKCFEIKKKNYLVWCTGWHHSCFEMKKTTFWCVVVLASVAATQEAGALNLALACL